ESGWLPSSFEVLKERQHLTVGGTVSDIYDGAVSSVVWKGRASEFAVDSDGRWTPKRFDVQRLTNWVDKPAAVERTQIEIESIVFDPPLGTSDFQTTIVAPPGYPVMVMDAGQLPYIWNGEAVVPGAPRRHPLPNEMVRGGIDESKAGGRTKVALIAFNIVVVAIAFGILLWRRKNA
ncbi:MAG TPA: hypothetical protein VFI31_03675, partial [Pirellulales bacterium]|nr:hypothetical protein [Pirellulales bacterium]